MRHRERFFISFFLFLFLSIGIFFVGKTSGEGGFFGVIESLVLPIQKGVFSVFSLPFFSNKTEQKLQTENASLHKKIVDQKNLEKENMALNDQFQTSYPKSQNLLPAHIVGMPNFIPNVSVPGLFIIDRGEKDTIKVGQAVVFLDNVIGKVTKVSKNLSVVTLITQGSSSFTASTEIGILGIVKGKGEAMLGLENVQASQVLTVGDTVTTKGDIDENGIGYPPNLVVGKITSIDKTQSNLFQSARVLPILDFSKLEMVFVMTQYE